jgi:3-phenylpropionate/cinnamic acid dioxygenase small subunit
VSADSVAICNLLYRYAEFMDLGDFAGAAALFAGARIRIGPGDEGFVDSAGVLAIWESSVIRYGDGTPRTKHVTTNAIVDIDASGASATARSYYTVFQQVDDFALQPIIAGRYHDRFSKVHGAWQWAERDYSLVDLVGDLSHHLTMDLGR